MPIEIVSPPDGQCQKCGLPNAFDRSRPRFDVDLDRLLWECDRCGYEVATRTADQVTNDAE